MREAKIIHAAFFTPMGRKHDDYGLPLVLIAEPGTAKTSAVNQFADAGNFHAECLATGEQGDGAYGVTPVPSGTGTSIEVMESVLKKLDIDYKVVDVRKAVNDVTDGGMVMCYPKPEWTLKLLTGDGEEVGLVFVDELNSAPPAIQPALMGLILAKRIGGHQLGPRVRVIGAMNPVEHAAGGYDLSAPVANRFGHWNWEGPTVEEWTNYHMGMNDPVESFDIEAEEARVTAAWPGAWQKAVALYTSWMRRRPEMLQRMPKDGDPKQSGPWSSGRTNEFAMRALASSFVHDLDEVLTDKWMASYVGQDAAGDFIQWMQAQDLPEPADLLDGTIKWAHDPTRMDRTMAVLSSCVALVIPPQAAKRKERAEALWKLLGVISNDAKDLTIPAAAYLEKSGLGIGKCKAAGPVLRTLQAVIDAAKEIK